jgi:hypothetical protein
VEKVAFQRLDTQSHPSVLLNQKCIFEKGDKGPRVAFFFAIALNVLSVFWRSFEDFEGFSHYSASMLQNASPATWSIANMVGVGCMCKRVLLFFLSKADAPSRHDTHPRSFD